MLDAAERPLDDGRVLSCRPGCEDRHEGYMHPVESLLWFYGWLLLGCGQLVLWWLWFAQ